MLDPDTNQRWADGEKRVLDESKRTPVAPLAGPVSRGTMLLAIKKDSHTSVPLGGFCYQLATFPMDSEKHAAVWRLMGWQIVEVDEATGHRLLIEASQALRHQVEIAWLVDGPKKATT